MIARVTPNKTLFHFRTFPSPSPVRRDDPTTDTSANGSVALSGVARSLLSYNSTQPRAIPRALSPKRPILSRREKDSRLTIITAITPVRRYLIVDRERRVIQDESFQFGRPTFSRITAFGRSAMTTVRRPLGSGSFMGTALRRPSTGAPGYASREQGLIERTRVVRRVTSITRGGCSGCSESLLRPTIREVCEATPRVWVRRPTPLRRPSRAELSRAESDQAEPSRTVGSSRKCARRTPPSPPPRVVIRAAGVVVRFVRTDAEMSGADETENL